MHIKTNLSEYVEIMKKRAMGELPEMGSAIRTVDLMIEKNVFSEGGNSIMDIGSATCHYFKTFLKKNIKIDLYAGIEIDKEMINAAKLVWEEEIANGKLILETSDIEALNLDQKFDISFCCNAFMYFKSPYKALKNMIQHTKKKLLIRGYFTDKSYRILRSQTSDHHEKSFISEADSFDKEGNLQSYDYWTIYSRKYIESIVKELAPKSKIEWIPDNNNLQSIDNEKNLNIKKRGATYVLDNMEISYPFIQPWEFLLISFDY